MVLSRRDKAVTVVLVAIIFILLYIMQCHWRNRFGARGDAKPVGEVEYKYHRVQRKYSDRMLWEEVESKSPIYAYDWVMTKEKSDARITLNNGMKVDMDPESMVEIDETREGVGLTLRDGTIRADTRSATGGTITAGDGTKIDLTKGEAHISTNGQAVSVDVKAGEATVRSGNSEAKAAAGEVVTRSSSGITKGKTVIALKAPQQEIVLDDPDRPVDFSFEAPKGSDDCQIHLNSGSKGERVVRVKAGTTHSEKLADGTYHWRATCKMQGEPVTSGTGVFRMRPAGSFAQVSPQANEVVPANSAESLALRWRSTEPVRVDLADNPNFNPVLKSTQSATGTYAVPTLKPGKYWWRVTSQRDASRRLESEFIVSDKGQVLAESDANAALANKPAAENNVNAPSAPGEKAAGSVKLTTRAPANITIEPDASVGSVNITWSPVNREMTYRVTASSDSTFQDEVGQSRVTGKGSARLKLPPGDYYYRVSASRKGASRPVAMSPAKKLQIVRKRLPPPPRVKSVQAE